MRNNLLIRNSIAGDGHARGADLTLFKEWSGIDRLIGVRAFACVPPGIAWRMSKRGALKGSHRAAVRPIVGHLLARTQQSLQAKSLALGEEIGGARMGCALAVAQNCGHINGSAIADRN
ncbi:hypothetical protein HQ576_19270 [bacterium]|nr:hypothetical protein [bacterium]